MTTKSKTAKIAKPATSAKPAAAKPTRVEHLHAMLSRAGGSSIAEIAEAFGGWEHHSCRGLISTGRRKLGWNVTTARADDGRGTVYSIAADRPQAAVSAKASATAKPETKAKNKAAAKPKAKPRSRAST
jgi:hypothetical protein